MNNGARCAHNGATASNPRHASAPYRPLARRRPASHRTASATLAGTTTRDTNAAGLATFDDLQVTKTATGYTLKAGSGSLTTNSDSTSFAITPAAAATLQVSAPATATAGSSFNLTVTARDSYGNVATGYTGTAHFTGGGTGATLPSNYTFTPGDNGTATFNASLTQAGNRTLTAIDGLPSRVVNVALSS